MQRVDVTTGKREWSIPPPQICWTHNIGERMIRDVELRFDSQTIDAEYDRIIREIGAMKSPKS